MSRPSLPSLLLPRSAAALGGMAAATANAALRVAIVPMFVTPVFDRVLGRDELAALPGILVAAAAIAIGGALALWAQDALLGRAAADVAARWREALFRDLLARSPGTLPGSSGGLSSRILTDLREVETYYHYGLGTLVAEGLTLVGVLGYLFTSNWQATALLVAFGVPGFVALRFAGRGLERVADRSQAGMESLGRILQEGFRHHETVRAFGADRHMLDRLAPANARTARDMSRRSFLSGAQIPLAQVLVFVAVGLLVAVLVQSVQRGAMTAGQMVSFLALVALLSTPLQLLPRGYAMLLQARSAGVRLRSLLLASTPASERSLGGEAAAPRAPAHDPDGRQRNAPHRPGAQPRHPGADATGHVSSSVEPDSAGPLLALHDLSFDYGGRPVLEGLTLSLPDRGLVAVGGASGSGKTTLLRLLMGFVLPTRGAVTFAGRSLAEVPDAELRRRMGYVPQEHALLSGTVRDNVALGRELDDARIWWALRMAGVADAVARLPGGLDYRVRDEGEGLSGGQRQRVAVARALAGSPDILLLDEPTSSLDEAAESALVRVLRDLAEDRLVIAVAHRPALPSAADVAYVLADGRIERIGRPGAREGQRA